MKKKIIALLLALVFTVTGIITGDGKVYAEGSSQEVDLSDIWTKDALVGYAGNQTRGVYLLDGASVINDAGGGKIGCGGMTTATQKCKVGVAVIVEKKVGSSWTRVTSWTATNASAYTVSTSKTLSVGSGYYYRVRCTHSANTDVSSSYTSGLWM